MRPVILILLFGVYFYSSASAAEQSPADIYRDAVGSVFALSALSETGQRSVASGFAVAPELVVTSYHAVDDARTIIVTPVQGSGSSKTGRILASDAQNDIAILEVSGLQADPLLIDGTLPAIGETVLSIGSPEGLAGSLTSGMVSGHRFIRGRELIQMNAPVERGNSGGPVLGLDGRVVGILHARVSERSSIGFANPAKLLLPLLGDEFQQSALSPAEPDPGTANANAPDPRRAVEEGPDEEPARSGTRNALRSQEPLLHRPDDRSLDSFRAEQVPDLEGEITIGVANWDSAYAVAHILAATIETRTPYRVTLAAGTLEELWEKFSAGEIDVISEFWLPNNRSFFATIDQDGGWGAVSDPVYHVIQGTCTTRQTQNALELYELSQLSDPAMARNFDSDSDGKGEKWIGVEGWGATRMERVKARDYGYAQTMDLLTSSEETSESRIREALASEEHVVFYCYAPHRITAMQEIVLLDEPPHSSDCFRFDGGFEEDWFERSHISCSAPRESVYLFAAERLAGSDPALFEAILSDFELPVGAVIDWLRRIETFERYEADPRGFTRRWISANPDILPEFHP